MNEFYEKAIERLRDDKGLNGNKERIMAPAVREALEKFCEEDGEFAQAVAQGGSFAECMQAVAKGVGGSISDIEAYRKAVQFYFPGAVIGRRPTDDCPVYRPAWCPGKEDDVERRI